MLKKRFFASLLLLILLLSLTLNVAAKTKISFWHSWSGEGVKAIDSIVNQFEKIYPDIDVEVILTTKMEQKLLVSIAGGAAPDVVLFDRYKTGQFAARGALTELDKFIENSSIKSEDFFNAAWGETIYRGKIYSIPYYVDNRALLYNKKLFEEAGLDPNDPPETWDELIEYSKKLTKYDDKGRITQVGFVPIWEGASLVHYIWQSGGTVFNDDMTKVVFNNEIGVNALQWIVDFIDMCGGVDELISFSSGFGAQINNPFYIGQVAMQSNGPWIYRDIERYAPDFLKNDLRIAPLPKNTEHATIVGGFSLIIPKGAPEPEAAWKFIQYLVQKENQIEWALASGTIPALKAAAYDDQIIRNDIWKGFVENMENGKYRPVHPAFPEVESYIYQAVDKAVYHKMTSKEALDWAAERAQVILDQHNLIIINN